MDIALMIEQFLPAAEYGGSTEENTKEAFDALRWEDQRVKPTWKDLETAWSSYIPMAHKSIIEERLDAMQVELDVLKVEVRVKYGE